MFGWWRITIFGVIFIIGISVWIFVFGISSDQSGSYFNKDHNAIWIGHEWVGEEKSDTEILNLVNDLKTYKFDTIFVHTGPLEENGFIEPETYKHAVNFIEKAKSYDDSINYQAWLGQIRNKIDLENEEVRDNITKISMILTKMVGFDGIHFDIEPVWDGDEAFISVLKETREKIGKEKKISVALAEYIPDSLIWFMENVHTFENYNTKVSYQNVSKYADQVIVMVYDTSLKKNWSYSWLVKEQLIRVTKIVNNGAEVFIAIPAYDGKIEVFDQDVENVENGLKGIIKGLNNIRSNEENFAGVAIYPYWEFDDNEKNIYADAWLY